MAQEVSAGSGVLVSAANTVASHRAQQQAIITGVETTVQTLMAGWKGTGATAFTATATQWVEDAKSIVAVLDRFESSLRGTDTLYQNTETEVASGAQQLAGASEGYHGVMA